MAGGGRPITVLNVAEKPSVAKAVSEILSRNNGGFRSREGRSRFNKIFEFEYTIRGQRCNMHFTSVLGHLMELTFEDRYDKWGSCDPVVLFHAPVHKKVPQDKLDLKRTLEEEARKCQWLVLWLDCDREGENIAFEVVEVCRGANPNLDVWRARFSALIERELRESVERLVRPNQLLADAADVRQEIDLRSGYSFTRFQTMLLRDAFHLDFATDDRNIILSYGPCQFPTLGFIVERYWEIQSHQPEEFWSINCTHNSDEGTATFSWMRGHIFDYTCAVILYEMCVEEPTATVTDVKKQNTRKYPPYPLSTIELEKRASRYFRMSSERTMKVAEELYQSGFISYPRTETDCFSDKTNLRAMVEEQQGHPQWGVYAQRLLNNEEGLWRPPSNGGHDDKAHPPIHPTKFSAGEPSWSEDHHKVYELVVRHFLACVSQPALGAETTVKIDIAGESFSASGRIIEKKNYLDVYRFESWGNSLLPTYNLGEQFIPTTLTLDSGVTRPPALLSEADLLTCMEKAGIGTDATMHEHIKKLLDRSYATKDASTRFSPTNLGEALVMGYDDMGNYELWKPVLRAKMEGDMKEVSLGTKTKAEVLTACLENMKALFLAAGLNKVKLFEAMDVFFDRSGRSGADVQHGIGDKVRRCGVCNELDMTLKQTQDGSFMVGCLGYPQCRNVVWLPRPVDEARVTSVVCDRCSQDPIFKIQFKFRRLEIPPAYSVEHLGCIGGCDDILKELIVACGTGSGRGRGAPTSANSNQQGRGRGGTASSSTSQQGRGRGSTASSSVTQQGRGQGGTTSSSARQQGNSRQMACVYCRQHGHSSAECPSQPSHSRTESRGMNQQNGESSMSCETCSNPCPLRTANTANNRGRKFFSCQGCNFFVWEDELNNNSNRNGRTSAPRRGSTSSASTTTRGRGRGRGRGGRSGQAAAAGGTMFVSATGEPTSDRRCYSCGDPSHFANACPNRGF